MYFPAATPAQIQRHASCVALNLDSSRPLATPSSVPYSHSVNKIRGSIAEAPGLPPLALFLFSSTLKTYRSTYAYASRALWSCACSDFRSVVWNSN